MPSETEMMIVDAVEKNGWHLVNYVPGADAADPDDIFTYTVGLDKNAGWPELIVLGLEPHLAFSMLSDLIEACWEKQQPPVAGMSARNILRDMPVKLVEFGNSDPRYFHYADWFAGHVGSGKPARLQLIWPDRNGVLPDDPACDPDIRAKQKFV